MKLFNLIATSVLGAAMVIGGGVSAAKFAKDSAFKTEAVDTATNELLFRINFKDNGSDSTSALTTSNFYSNGVTSVVDKNSANVTSTFSSAGVVSATKTYAGTGGLKCGSNKNASDFEINIPAAYQDKITFVTINCTNETRDITVSGGGKSATLSAGNTSFGDHDLAINSTSVATTLSVSIASASKTAAYIASLSVYKANVSETYTVSFNENGGTGSMSNVTGVYGNYTLPSNGFTAPSNKVFTGWKANNAGDLIAAGASYSVTEDVTFYAQWANAYSVTYSAGTNGTGSYAHENQPAGFYTLLPFADLIGISSNTGYQFKNYTVGGIDKNPGETITLSSDTSVTVNFEEKPLGTTYDFRTNFATYASSWDNSYSTHEGLRGTTDIGGEYAATINLYKASKQTATITNMPVFASKTASGSWYPAVHFTLTESGYKIKTVSVTFAQWGTKTPDIALFKGNGVASSVLDSGTLGTKNTITTANLNGTDFTIGYCDKNSSSNVQGGLQSIEITIEPLASFGTLDHITITGMPNVVYHVGETYDPTGFAVTAYDGNDEAIANFKDVTSSVVQLLDDTYTFVEGDVPGFDEEVEYEEGGKNVSVSYHVYVYALAEYELVTSEPADWSGNYLIVGTNSDSDLCAMNGGLADPDVIAGYKVVSDTDGVIEAGQELEWTIAAVAGGYSFQGKSNKYIGSLTAENNGMLVSNSAVANTLSISGSDVTVQGTNGYKLKLNTTANRFRYYENGTVKLYKLKSSNQSDAFAQTFLGAFVCNVNGTSEPTFNLKEGETYWSWTLLKVEYNNLTAVEKEEFRLGVANESGDNIAKALARYDYIVAKYGEVKYENFMNRSISPLSSRSYAPVVTNNPMIIVITASTILALASVGAILILRKKKYSK